METLCLKLFQHFLSFLVSAFLLPTPSTLSDRKATDLSLPNSMAPRWFTRLRSKVLA
jgi:hypothetical protein